MTPPVYRQHIRRAKAKPDACPVCGASSQMALPGNTFGDLLKAFYSHPNRVEQRAVPGWPGFKTWWFVCEHRSPMEAAMFCENPFLAMVPRSGFQGGAYTLPVPLGGK